MFEDCCFFVVVFFEGNTSHFPAFLQVNTMHLYLLNFLNNDTSIYITENFGKVQESAKKKRV